MAWKTRRPAHNIKDLRGQVFGSLMPICPSLEVSSVSPKRWMVWCSACSSLAFAVGRDMTRGHNKTCGCGKKNGLVYGEDAVTHGQAKRGQETKEHMCWSNMKARCGNPQNTHYKHYGGRGITVCERWLTFENFYEDMGEVPEGKTLDRINNDGNYEPGNCRWSTDSEQMKNRRPMTAEARKNMSLARIGKKHAPHSEETKRKISESNRLTKRMGRAVS